MRTVLHGVSLAIGAGEAVGLVGESGSGKSMTARTIMRLLPHGAEVGGTSRFDGRTSRRCARRLRDYRARGRMVFQDPRAHINPVRTIGDFLTEALRTIGTSAGRGRGARA